MAHATTTARRAWLLQNPYDERYPRCEDRELFTRVCRTVRRAHIGEPLYLHCHRKDAARTLRDYVASGRDFRLLAARVAGPFAAAPLVAESLAKEAVFRAVTALGKQEVLIRRRARPPTDAERAEAANVLRRIRAAHVPGLDPDLP